MLMSRETMSCSQMATWFLPRDSSGPLDMLLSTRECQGGDRVWFPGVPCNSDRKPRFGEASQRPHLTGEETEAERE